MPRHRTNLVVNHLRVIEERRPLDDLFTLAYHELRRLASSVKRGDPSVTLTPTALVHEAWLKLRSSPQVAHGDRLRFKQIAAHAMREVLIEAARRRRAQKRGGGAPFVVAFDESLQHPPADEETVLALDQALQDLSRIAPRQALLVESRFFGGLAVSELAELLDVSTATVVRDWRAAKAWLAPQLRR